MSNEIKLTVNLKVTNGDYKGSLPMGQLSLDQTTQGAQSGIQNVGTTAEDLDVGDVSTPGILVMRNLDTTNFVEIGKDVSSSFEKIGRMKPGDPFVMRVAAGVTLQLKADTAACNVQVMLLEE